MGRFISRRTRGLGSALAVAGVLAAIGVAGASAGDFVTDEGPCRETATDGALVVCPAGYVGAPYQVQVGTDPISGCYPFILIQIVNSALPPGLSMTQTGLISGTPTETGLTHFWLWNHDLTAAQGGPDWCAFDDVSQREFSIRIDPGFEIVNTAAKPGTIGQPYSDKLTARRFLSLNARATGSDAAAAWWVESGALPPGVSLSREGLLEGTPTAEGSYHFVVRADLLNGNPAATHDYTIPVRQPVDVQSPFGPREAPGGEVGVRLKKSFTAAGGSGTYTWSLSSGALPAGVALDGTSGTISGTPLNAGSYQFVLTATDSEGRAASTNGAIRVAARLVLKTAHLRPATMARAYHAKLTTRGGVRPLKWRIVRGKVPPGIVLSPVLGTLKGAPRAAGSFRVTVEARDVLGAKSRKTLVLLVNR